MGKNPAFQFYPGDWSRDLEEHPLEIEGAWIRICCKLWWSETQGELSRTLEQWARILRESEEKTLGILRYVQREKIGEILQDLTAPNGDITVISRRMLRDGKIRESNRLRQKRHYRKRQPNGAPNANLTPPSSSSTSSSKQKSTKKGRSILTKIQQKLFDRFWDVYPKKKSKGRAEKAWSQINPDEQLVATMCATIERATKSKDWRKENGEFIPYPASWLNARGWEDEFGLPPPKKKPPPPPEPPKPKTQAEDLAEYEAALAKMEAQRPTEERNRGIRSLKNIFKREQNNKEGGQHEA